MEIVKTIIPLLVSAKKASIALQRASDQTRQAILHTLAEKLLAGIPAILAANALDLSRMDDADPKKDRLMLTEARIRDLSKSCVEVAKLIDPTGQIISDRVMENGLHIQKVAVPLGVIGVIYESRPNVTIDVAALCLRSGNAVVLRGGTDALYSNQALVALIHEVLQAHHLPIELVTLLPPDRALVQELLTATDYVDMLIPRGSKKLIDFVRDHARVPSIETGAGVCHTYVTATANLEKAAAIVVNAKVTRPSVCNSLDTILVDEAAASRFLPMIIGGMLPYQVRMFADKTAYNILKDAGYPFIEHATEEDFGREYLSYQCSVKVVDGMEEALAHIATYSSKHSEAIVSEDPASCARFLNEVDAAAVFMNTSTRFSDGGVFGLGAEIGISTQKLHARGPFALEKLVTEKWVVRGDGQIR